MSASAKGMLLAAGLGTRMRPLTDALPKPLIAVAGKTLLDRALDWFLASGVGEVAVNTHYKSEMIEAHVASRTAPRLHMVYEPMLLETGGGIKNALPWLGGAPFFCANSDAICIDGETPALQRMREYWDDAAMDALLLVVPLEKAIGYEGAGDFFVDAPGGIKRRDAQSSAPYVFTGIQLVHPRLFDAAPAGPFSMNLLYNRDIAPGGTLARIRAVVHDGTWLHVGDPRGLQLAQEFLANSPYYSHSE
jgi:MurNAc alpha-1-phosphate uridylyltransferase